MKASGQTGGRRNLRRGLARTAVVLAVLAAGAAQAELTANIGVTNNYIWRGITQTDDEAAVSGGLDYSHDSGFYAGTWASNVDFGVTGTEVDLYLGYAGEAGEFGYDIGYIYYAYPDLDDIDFSEVYVSGSFAGFTLGVNFQVDADATDADYLYVYGNYEYSFGDDYTLTFDIGHYDLDGDTLSLTNDDSYVHYGVSLSKSDFTLGLVQNDIDLDLDLVDPPKEPDDLRVVVSWGREF